MATDRLDLEDAAAAFADQVIAASLPAGLEAARDIGFDALAIARTALGLRCDQVVPYERPQDPSVRGWKGELP